MSEAFNIAGCICLGWMIYALVTEFIKAFIQGPQLLLYMVFLAIYTVTVCEIPVAISFIKEAI